MKSIKPIQYMRKTLNIWRQRFNDYAQRCVESGFIPHRLWGVPYLTRLLARLMVFIQVGRLRIIGKENLEIPGTFVFCPNHSSMHDGPVLYSIMKRPEGIRYMTAYQEMLGVWGLKAIVMGAMGCFPVNRKAGKTVIPPAIDMLVAGESIGMFPEGGISETGVCLPFKRGPSIIGKGALQRLEEPGDIGIIPIKICYHTRHNDTAKSLYWTMGLKWRGGVTVTVGKPIYLSQRQSQSHEEIMTEVHDFLCQQKQLDSNISKCNFDSKSIPAA